MTVTVRSGESEIVASGSFFTFGDSPIEICLHDVEVKGSDFYVKVVFVKDENDKTPRHRVRNTENNSEFCLELINYDGPLGTGVLSPMQFAENKKGVKFSMAFMVSIWEPNLSKRFTYTIFRTMAGGEGVSNGQG